MVAALLACTAPWALGIEGPKRTTHVAGGADNRGAPYEALVLVSYPRGSGVTVRECSGAVVGQRWIVTAAHCLTRTGAEASAELHDGLETRVIVARADVRSLRAARGRDSASALLDEADRLNALRGQAYGIPPDYRPGTSRYGDVALIRVDRSVNSTLGVPLARPDQADVLRPGRSATVSGWGDTGNGTRATTLQSAPIPLREDVDCASTTGAASLFTFVGGAMVCGGGPGANSGAACEGDSGGPLISRTASGHRLLTGVVSFGDVSCGGGPTFFTRVDAFASFLGDLMDADPVAGISSASVESADITGTGFTGAQLSAAVDPNGASTALEVVYSPTIASLSRTAGAIAGSGRSPSQTSVSLAGLAPGTTYEYTTSASSVLGRRGGPSGRFRTSGEAREPVVVDSRVRCADPGPGVRRGAGNGSLDLTVDQLVINQRIGQAALNRVNAIEAWLDEGLTADDFCGASIGPESLDGVSLRDALRIEPELPEPRELTVSRLGPAQPGQFRLNRRQLLINQRIYQAALRKARAVRRRVEGGLTGGDIRDGSLGIDHLAPGSIVTSTSFRPDPGASVSVVPPAPRAGQAVSVDLRQLRINQKIAQAAIRETRRVIGRLEIGLVGENFQPESIVAADLQQTALDS